MKEIIEWLIEVENRAHKVYERAAMQFKDNKECAECLWRLAADEREHYDFMRRAAELIEGMNYTSAISLSNETKQKIDDYFSLCEKRIDALNLTKEGLVDFIVSTEFSEWNDIYLYVMNVLNHKHKEFTPGKAKLQQHKRYIERFLEAKPEFRQYLRKIQALPKILEEKILVVDDDSTIVHLFAAILENEGAVETAANGEEGLKKLSEKYFSAIVADVDMPVMDGIEFYKKAVETYPHMNGRFLFLTGSDSNEHIAFFRKNNLKYLTKPSPIGDIKKAVVDILLRKPQSSST